MKDLPISDNGESNALFVGSYKDRKNKVTIVQGESKKMSVKEMFDFLTLKMLPLALALIKTKNHHLFDPLVRK